MRRNVAVFTIIITVLSCLTACKSDNKISEDKEKPLSTVKSESTQEPENTKEIQSSAKTDATNNDPKSDVSTDIKDDAMSTVLYKVCANLNNSKTQIGAFADYENAKKLCDSKPGFKVYDMDGNLKYSGVLENMDENQAIIFYPSDELTTISTEKVTLKDTSIDGLINALINKKVLKENTKAVGFKISEDKKKATLDMSKEFFDMMNSYGTSGEIYTMSALCNTVITYFDLETMEVTYDSNVLETGHAIYDEEMYFSKY